VLLGTGIVGIYFGMLTNDVMEAQEEALTSRLVQAAVAMNKLAGESAAKVQEFQQEQHRKFLEYVQLHLHSIYAFPIHIHGDIDE
jgi:hypothetical protein